MADSGLFALYKLHLVDAALYAIKERAANLGATTADREALAASQAEFDRLDAAAKELEAEMGRLEAENTRLNERAKKLHNDLYGAGFLSPRDVETVQQELAGNKELVAKHDERLLELYELVPPARELADQAAAALREVKVGISKKQTAAKAEHEKLQATYRAKAAERAPLVANVPRQLLESYERLREKLGTGMAMVADNHRCESCGMPVPEKAYEHIVEDRITACENCRRILFRLQQS